MTIGIIGAMQEEVHSIVTLLSDAQTHTIGDRCFTQGRYLDKDVVVVYSRVGKVSSASTATTLINHFGVKKIIFTGIAGAVAPHLNVGDIVIGDKCIQHDMDASPIFPKYEIPLTGNAYFASEATLVEKSYQAAQLFVDEDFSRVICEKTRDNFNIAKPAVHIGTIASGDQFISCPHKINSFRSEIDNIMAVEMEGAAVSQVCTEYNVPFTVIRTISDKANHDAPIDFNLFLKEVTSFYAVGIIKRFLQLAA